MNPDNALLTIALFAAFADGVKDDREREHVRRFAESLGTQAPDLPRLYQDVLLKRVTLRDATSALGDLGQRQFAYEMALCICDADGRQCDTERAFLADLKRQLCLDGDAQVADAESKADALANLDEYAPATVVAPAAVTASVAAAQPAPSDAELDKTILNYAILNGALELLPQTWASVAIIPLQIKMVYRIGRAHGYELDQGHIKEFLATVGVGLTSQYLEQFGRKLLGGLLGKMAGKTVGGLGRAATGMAFSFASTYALGHIAKRYYAGGRQMSAAALQQGFQQMLEPAKKLQADYLPQMRQRASGLDAGQIMAMVRGG